nr:transposase [Alicyclobacillus pomorum]
MQTNYEGTSVKRGRPRTLSQTYVEVESVFGQLKANRGFRRFHLRGLLKTHIEVGLVSLAHNLMKKAALSA